MALIEAARVSRAPMAGLSAVGVLWGSFAALVPDIKAGVGASDGQMGLILLMSAVGGIIAMSVAPRLSEALEGRILPFTALLLAIAVLGPALAAGPAGLAVALFVMGGTVSLLDISANMRISHLEDRHRLHLMNINHAMFSFAFAAAATVVSLARAAGAGPGRVLPLVALALLALGAAMIERRWTPPEADADGDAPARRLPWAAILPAAAILFASFICENATEAWSALHIERTLGAAPGEGGFGPAMLGLTMGVGRLSGQLAAARLGEARLVQLSSVLAVAGALVLAAAPTPAVALVGIALLGLGVAVVVPSANSLLGRAVRRSERSRAISRAWMIGFTGFFIGPSAIGMIAEASSLRWAFAAVALVAATILPSVGLLARRSP